MNILVKLVYIIFQTSENMLHILHIFLFVGGVLCMSGTNIGVTFDGNGDCMIEDHSVICRTNLPQVLPKNITKVTVKNFSHDSINQETFKHDSWWSVHYLDVIVNENVEFRLYDYNFYGLKNLETLGIHSSELPFSTNNILKGLLKLQSLNLSSCFHLNTERLVTNLEVHDNLDTLILDQFGTREGRHIILDNAFFKMISRLSVRKLSLSGTNLLFQGPLNIANLSYSLTDFDISNITFAQNIEPKEGKQVINTVLSKVKILNISHISSRFLPFDYTFMTHTRYSLNCSSNLTSDLLKRFFKVERLEMNHVLSRIVKIKSLYLDISECRISFKSLYLRSNNIHFLNATVKWPRKLNFYELDLSQNNLEYISPYVFGSVPTLERIHLSHNKLYLMASVIEFKFLFSTFKNLWYLDLSNNQLALLPEAIFADTFNLTTLDLSNNHFASISFRIKHLTKLHFLNLENNKIHYIDGVDFSNLLLLIQTMQIPANISFLRNPIVCSCESVSFIKWLSSYVRTRYKIEKSGKTYFMCSLEGKKVPLETNAVDESEFLCVRKTIEIASVSSGIAIFCIISVVTAIFMYRKRQKRRAENMINFLEDFKNGLLQQNVLCFLSFSSDDEGNDPYIIYEHLTETLKEKTGIKREVVCVGNRHFNLGFPIVDEIVRCLSESCVAAFIVSNNFCESRWCQMELREAYELNKPIILICREHIDLTLMTPLMSKIFLRYTRAKLITKEDDRVEIVPGYEQLASSILKLAAIHNDNVAL
ncbi:toll-like receptor 4 [Mercenaria mercenaria]|uniref:toll-like receptor 4 n=1 Tax=Mercenaria mercenaria TaxID=6596 RepID=UPI00234F2810|nr:toll-like receptor 4 [Mercenaria mercenaria]